MVFSCPSGSTLFPGGNGFVYSTPSCEDHAELDELLPEAQLTRDDSKVPPEYTLSVPELPAEEINNVCLKTCVTVNPSKECRIYFYIAAKTTDAGSDQRGDNSTPDALDTIPDSSDTIPDSSDTIPDSSHTIPDSPDSVRNARDTALDARDSSRDKGDPSPHTRGPKPRAPEAPVPDSQEGTSGTTGGTPGSENSAPNTSTTTQNTNNTGIARPGPGCGFVVLFTTVLVFSSPSM